VHGDNRRGTPLGCFTGVLAIIPLGLLVVSGYGLWLWFATPAENRPDGLFGLLIGGFVAGLAFFILLIWLSIRILKNTRWKDYDAGKDTSLHY
jgi:hypothetical protein